MYMGIKFSKYSLTPVAKLNRFDTKLREGCYFSLDDKYFLDYCPWKQFGDLSVDEILISIKVNNDIPKLFKKLFEVDSKRKRAMYKSFLNHDLNIQKNSNIIKVKCDENTDLSLLLNSFSRDCQFRLDYNNSLSYDSFKESYDNLTKELRARINYIEDPFVFDHVQWAELQMSGIRLATDRNVLNSISKVIVYKPGIDISMPESNSQEIIFSSYMGSELNTLHTYLEAIDSADLNLHHGILTPNIFDHQIEIIKNITADRFVMDKKNMNKLYDKLGESSWTSLI
jgi:hypothetical protein